VLAGLFFPAPEMWLSMFDPLVHAVGPVPEAMAASSVSDAMAAGAAAFGSVAQASAAQLQGGLNLQQLGSSELDPSTFVPVCQFADTFYRSAVRSLGANVEGSKLPASGGGREDRRGLEGLEQAREGVGSWPRAALQRQ
jgi:hypothetical protein